ncbi:MAG: Quinolinate phosphoribosyltransferase [decarboxylating] [uncultured Solirubrobacteraceae bacterium]|uniref:Nicotinate-nucleotide pyrophosphorylase [carboxylating] n=1 Tax=uncultured Solirubrobacteraceae bacterium TaxID=1162706 RepID=A0A6J4T4Z4_9ACTN|nr:MAG: Quinolinate phosphoribosyltransferase [decarboxylating] [uncultured Solirubrobacteraceae bacterium]
MSLGSHTLEQVVLRALAEDVGDIDVTSEATVPAGTRAVATITQKAPGVVFGLDAAEAAFVALDPDVTLERLGPEGQWREPPAPMLRATGDARALLAAERTALNFLQRLSGIATLTARCVQAVRGTGVQILDTRKTTPGLRTLEKAAVAAGGGVNHRAGLYDMVLIKENHVALAGGVGAAVRAAAAAFPELALEVECSTRADVDEALAAGAQRILLDNMNPAELRATVAHVAGRARLEASGGIGLDALREHAQTGVDCISVGALTHSAPALDLSLLLEALP